MPITYTDVLRTQISKLEIEKIPHRPAAMLGILPKESQLQRTIEWDVNIGGSAVGGRATTADVSATDDAADTWRKASLPISQHLVSHKFSILHDLIIEARAIGRGAVANLFQSHIDMAYEVILQGLNQLLYTGTGNAASRGVFGLNAARTAGYAGLTATDWIAYVDANGGTARALTRSMFERIDVNVRRKNGTYNAIVTTPELIRRYQSLFATDRTYQARGVGNGLPLADIGYSGASYNGIPLFEDNDCPNGTMYFLDLRKIKLKTFASRDVTSLDGRTTKANLNGSSTFGMDWQIAQINNRNPDLLEFEIGVKPQLWMYQPKFVSVVADIIQTV